MLFLCTLSIYTLWPVSLENLKKGCHLKYVQEYLSAFWQMSCYQDPCTVLRAASFTNEESQTDIKCFLADILSMPLHVFRDRNGCRVAKVSWKTAQSSQSPQSRAGPSKVSGSFSGIGFISSLSRLPKCTRVTHKPIFERCRSQGI